MAGTSSTTPELLQEGAGLLKQELLLGTEALQAAQQLRALLRERTPGQAMPEALGQLERVLGQLTQLSRRLDDFLARTGAARLTAFFTAQLPSQERARSRCSHAPRHSSARCGASSRVHRRCSRRARRSRTSM